MLGMITEPLQAPVENGQDARQVPAGWCLIWMMPAAAGSGRQLQVVLGRSLVRGRWCPPGVLVVDLYWAYCQLRRETEQHLGQELQSLLAACCASWGKGPLVLVLLVWMLLLLGLVPGLV